MRNSIFHYAEKRREEKRVPEIKANFIAIAEGPTEGRRDRRREDGTAVTAA